MLIDEVKGEPVAPADRVIKEGSEVQGASGNKDDKMVSVRESMLRIQRMFWVLIVVFAVFLCALSASFRQTSNENKQILSEVLELKKSYLQSKIGFSVYQQNNCTVKQEYF